MVVSASHRRLRQFRSTAAAPTETVFRRNVLQCIEIRHQSGGWRRRSGDPGGRAVQRLGGSRTPRTGSNVDGLYPPIASAIGHFTACSHGSPRVDHAAEISCRIGYFGDPEPTNSTTTSYTTTIIIITYCRDATKIDKTRLPTLTRLRRVAEAC